MDPLKKFLVNPTKSSTNQLKLKNWDRNITEIKAKMIR